MANPAPELAWVRLDRAIRQRLRRGWRHAHEAAAVGTERTLLEKIALLFRLGVT